MHDIIATSPIVNVGEGYAATRIVLRQVKSGREFVVHKQRFYEDGSTGFDHGNYFWNNDPESIHQAWDCFAERSRNLLVNNPLFDLAADPIRFTTLLEQGGQGGE